MQTKLGSLIETLTNIAIGYVVSFIVQIVVFEVEVHIQRFVGGRRFVGGGFVRLLLQLQPLVGRRLVQIVVIQLADDDLVLLRIQHTDVQRKGLQFLQEQLSQHRYVGRT